MTRVGVATVSSPMEVGADTAPAALTATKNRLESAGFAVVDLGRLGDSTSGSVAGRAAAVAGVAVYVVVPVSWFEDYHVLDMIEEWSVPLFLWPQPGMETGALCGAQQLGWLIRQLGVAYGWTFGPIDSDSCAAQASAYIRAAGLRWTLRRARIGLAGHRLNGMTHTAPDELRLKQAVGPRVVHLDLPSLLQAARAAPSEETAELWQRMTSLAGRAEVSRSTGTAAMGFYLALRQQVGEHDLAALTVGCYPELMGMPCLAASLLADENVPLACEGDVHGAVGMLMLTSLSNEPVHSTDWLDPLPDDTVVFTHCGSGSFSLAADRRQIVLSSVRLAGEGVCALFPAKPGPVTLVSISATAEGYQTAVLEGEALSSEMVFPGNPVRVRFEVPTAQIIDWIFENGLGHHWSVGYGHHAATLRQWGRMAGPGLRVLEP